MTKPLKRVFHEELHHHNGDSRVAGPTPALRGDCTGLWGECTGLSGDCSGLSGDCTGLSGNLDGIPLDARPAKIADFV